MSGKEVTGEECTKFANIVSFIVSTYAKMEKLLRNKNKINKGTFSLDDELITAKTRLDCYQLSPFANRRGFEERRRGRKKVQKYIPKTTE